MSRFSSLLSSLTIALLVPSLAYAGNCDTLCSLNANNAKERMTNPACKNDPTCVSCVSQSLGQSQSGMQCAAYGKSQKGKTGEIINAAINTAATITCGVACGLSNAGPAAAGSVAWGKICGFAGLAVTATEVGFTVANLIKGEKGDWLGLATKALGAQANLNLAKTGTAPVIEAQSTVGKMIANPACLNTVMFGVAAAMKIASVGKMGKASADACTNAQSLASGLDSSIQGCLAAKKLNASTSSTSLAGFFTPTHESFPVPTIDDADHQAASVGQYLKNMKSDMKFAETQGKFNLADIAKKIESGSGISDLIADQGIPSQLTDAIKSAEDQMKKTDTSALLAAVNGAPAAGNVSVHVDSGMSRGDSSELAFGSTATPGEGAESLEIERKPAQAVSTASLDGDVFHGAYHGTIFDIVTDRLKAQKGNYAELDPEGRMNRLFNGYGEPGRKPAEK